MRLMKYGKRGATIVEASMIFPLVIAAVMAVIYIVIGLYSSLSLQSSIQLSIRMEAGKLSNTVYCEDQRKDYPSQKSRMGMVEVLTAEEEKQYKVTKLFTKDIKKTEKGRVYVINEAKLVRPFYCVKGNIQ